MSPAAPLTRKPMSGVRQQAATRATTQAKRPHNVLNTSFCIRSLRLVAWDPRRPSALRVVEETRDAREGKNSKKGEKKGNITSITHAK